MSVLVRRKLPAGAVSIGAMGNTRPLPQPTTESAWPLRSRSASRARRHLKRAAVTLAIVVIVSLLGIAALWVATPSASEATQLARGQAKQHGIAYPGPRVPANFARPLIATEDKRFYSEPGVDILAVGRVVWAKLTGGTDQGGATLEQQLAKLLYTPTQSGVKVELKQVVLAFKLNAAYSKSQILGLVASNQASC
jgi:membrane peptidoglycan carboxypeptidase